MNDMMAPTHITITNVNTAAKATSWWNLQHILMVLYAIGALAVLTRYLIQTIPWIKLIPKDENEYYKIKIVTTNQLISPFSFLNTIFLGNQEFNDNEMNKIISHEKQHILQYHWIDLLIVDVLSILFWFNPMIWIYDLLIRQNHEYLADNGVIAQGFNKSSYQALLLQQVVGIKIPGLSSSFSRSLIKNRFIMMTKKHSQKITGLKTLFALPILLLLTIIFAGNTNGSFNSSTFAEIQKGKITGYVYDISTGEPLEGASVVLKEKNYGTSTNSKGYFEMENPMSKASLLISYVGYETEQVKLSDKEVKVMMRRATYKVKLKDPGSLDVDDTPAAAPPPPPPGKESSPPKQVDEEYVVVEDMAMPEGGFAALSEYILFEKGKYQNELSGNSVKVFFTVNEIGKVIHVKIEESSGNKKADETALKIVNKIPDWKPAYQRGKNVSSDYTIDIEF